MLCGSPMNSVPCKTFMLGWNKLQSNNCHTRRIALELGNGGSLTERHAVILANNIRNFWCSPLESVPPRGDKLVLPELELDDLL